MASDTSLVPLTRLLADEHRLIQRSVVLLARFCAHVRRADEFDPGLAHQFLHFFRVFLEHHLRREELVLFPWIRQHADAESNAAVDVLQAEHAESRELLSAIEAILEALERHPSDPESRACFCAFGERYAALLSEHDWKEDHLLYPLAEYLDDASHELRTRVPEGFVSCLQDPEEFSRWAEDVEALACDWPREEVDLHRESLLRDHV
jgi:hemerythrin-like domain-containing protein